MDNRSKQDTTSEDSKLIYLHIMFDLLVMDVEM